jgi:hypothetical protein
MAQLTVFMLATTYFKYKARRHTTCIKGACTRALVCIIHPTNSPRTKPNIVKMFCPFPQYSPPSADSTPQARWLVLCQRAGCSVAATTCESNLMIRQLPSLRPMSGLERRCAYVVREKIVYSSMTVPDESKDQTASSLAPSTLAQRHLRLRMIRCFHHYML